MYKITSLRDSRQVEQSHLPIQQHQHLGWKEQPKFEKVVIFAISGKLGMEKRKNRNANLWHRLLPYMCVFSISFQKYLCDFARTCLPNWKIAPLPEFTQDSFSQAPGGIEVYYDILV